MSTQSPRSAAIGAIIAAGTVGAVVFSACLFGIYTRPLGLLAAVWPANAILLAVLVRNPKLATRYGYIGATIGFILADLLTGSKLFATLLLTAANLAGVTVGHVLYSRLDYNDQRLRRPHSVLYLLVIAAAAAFASGIGGSAVGPFLFNETPSSGGTFWFATEFVNYIAILPVMLAAPSLTTLNWRQLMNRRRVLPDAALSDYMRHLLPAAALLLACTFAEIIGGPGAVAFPVPALLWCALVYNQWVSTIFTLLFSFWILLAVTTGHVGSFDFGNRHNLLSLRIDIALIALGPIMVASVMAARNELVDRLERMAAHDHLTGLLNRRAFNEKSGRLLAALASERAPVSVLMLDIDHFKNINDSHGHQFGDHVLITFSALIEKCVRETELTARLGGEEFGVLFPYCKPEEAAVIAQRICKTFAETEIWTSEGEPVTATVSIGAAYAEIAPTELSGLLATADLALYRAKAAGRNRVELSWSAATNGPPPVLARRVASSGAV